MRKIKTNLIISDIIIHMNDKKMLSVSLSMLVSSFILAIIFLVLGILIGVYGPFGNSDNLERTIKVNGSAKVTATPDESVFFVSFQEKDIDKVTARTKVVQNSDEVVSELKVLGVDENSIKSDISTYDDYDCDRFNCQEPTGFIANNDIQIKLQDLDLAEKVYNYLLTSEVSGRVTPSVNFSDEKKKELTSLARKDAAADARTQAKGLAEEVEAKLGDVVTISEKQGFDHFYNDQYEGPVSLQPYVEDQETSTSSELLTGEQDLRFIVEVVFELK